MYALGAPRGPKGVTYRQCLRLGPGSALQCPQQLYQHLPIHALVSAQAAPQLSSHPGGAERPRLGLMWGGPRGRVGGGHWDSRVGE